MENLFVEYPKCSTCKKAKNYLLNNDIEFTAKHIVEDVPTKEELAKWYKDSGLELKKFFNTSGILYREMQLKDKLKDMSDDEMLELLSSNGMLIKRPIFVGKGRVLVGFKEDNYKTL